MQSHKCAFLDPIGDECHCDEYCQYKLYPAPPEYTPVICGSDQLIAIQVQALGGA